MNSTVKPTSGRSKKVKALTSSDVPVAGRRIALDHQLVVVAVDRLGDVAVEIGKALRIGGAGAVLPLAEVKRSTKVLPRALSGTVTSAANQVWSCLRPQTVLGVNSGQLRQSAASASSAVWVGFGVAPGELTFDRGEDLGAEIGDKAEELLLLLDVVIEQPELGRQRIHEEP